MHGTTLLAVLLSPLAALAAPTARDVYALSSRGIGARQGGAAQFCQPMDPEPTPEELEARFDAFAEAFLVKKDISEAFSYIAPSYINHNPMAQNGAQNAYNILSPMWGGLQITVLRTKHEGNMSWLNYRVSGMGEVVDRYRWEDGCIAEHWDQGERFPAE